MAAGDGNARADATLRRAATVTHKDPLIAQLISRRQSLGWSVKDLGERCGIDETFLLDWERGVALPRLDAMRRWGAALGVDLALVAGEAEPHRRLKIDWGARRVTVDGTPVRLTPMEWRGLERLVRTPGELVTHQALYRHLYGDERPYRAQSTAIRVLITKLRRLLPLQIEARWGKGYVVGGFEPAVPHDKDTGEGSASGDGSAVALARHVRDALSAKAAAQRQQPLRHSALGLGNAAMPGAAPAPGRLAFGRAEELGVIERFLAERGVTRCPDAATIQQSPLPTLVWDKIKRKWVRPPMTGREAS